jgi:AraC-like DNA-binding protein
MRLRQHDLTCLEAARQMINKNYFRKLSIKDIAREVGLSNTKLKDGFRQVFGVPIYTYMIKVRMEHAKALLGETENSILSIAIATGYKTSSSFILAFRRLFSITPAQYRKSL